MADTTPKFVFNEVAVKTKFAKLEDSVNKQIGKKGYNPYLFLNQKVNPLVDRYTKGERSPELQTAILALPDSIPAVLPSAVDVPVPTQAVTPAALQQPVTATLPDKK